MRFFAGILIFRPFTTEIDVSLTLIAFGYGVPVLLRRVDAVLLHPCINEFILTLADFAEVVKLLPQLNIEAVADDIQQRRERTLRQVVENFRRSIAERGYGDGKFALAPDVRQQVFGPVSKIHLQNLALDRAADEMHRYFAPVFMYEPLGEIVFERNIEAYLAHNLLINYIQSYRKSAD